jgi:hypothetical protein
VLVISGGSNCLGKEAVVNFRGGGDDSNKYVYGKKREILL